MSDAPPEGAALSGRRIVLTRPEGRSGPLAALIRAAGGEALDCPAIDIADPADPAPFRDALERLADFHIAIFISPTAVDRAMPALLARGLPAGLALAAVGQGSARALAAHGARAVIAPRERFDSEALLELPEMRQVAGRAVLILRGEGGRETLREVLQARGARVEAVACYRRQSPAALPEALVLARRLGADGLVATSGEGLANLHRLLDPAGQAWLASLPVFVPHPRIAAAARALGLARVEITDGGDAGMFAGLCRHFAPPAPGAGAVAK